MLFEDTYLTTARPAEASYNDRGSRFIAYSYPLTSEAEIKEHVQQLKALHPKANHHCWAMRLTPDRSVFRVNDDGEPSGTAGRPILNVLLSKDITDTLVVVVRYFGGKLLGVPGLINAYKTVTEQALAAAGTIEKISADHYAVTFSYVQMNDVMKVLKEDGIKILEQITATDCTVKAAIRKSKVNHILNRLENIQDIKIAYYTI